MKAFDSIAALLPCLGILAQQQLGLQCSIATVCALRNALHPSSDLRSFTQKQAVLLSSLCIALSLCAFLSGRDSPLSSVALSIAVGAVQTLPILALSTLSHLLSQSPNTLSNLMSHHALIPLSYTAMFMLARNFSPFGSWPSWPFAYALDPSLKQMASVGGLPMLDLYMALWAECIVSVAQAVVAQLRVVETYDAVPESSETGSVHENRQHDQDLIQVFDGETSPLLPKNEDPHASHLLAYLYSPFAIMAVLLAVSLISTSSYSTHPLPESESTFIKLGCVADFPTTQPLLFSPVSLNETTVADHYLSETNILAAQGAKIILWPESPGILTQSTSSLNQLLSRAHEIAARYKVYIGVTYLHPASSLGESKLPFDPVRGKLENRISLMGPSTKEPIFTYVKVHPVPLVETSRMVSGAVTPPPVAILDAIVNPKKGSKRALKVSAAICLDMDFPGLWNGIDHDVDLVLSPAGTWSVGVGDVHVKMAGVRAIENGFSILRCDARGGVSGFLNHQGKPQVVYRGVEMHDSFLISVALPLKPRWTFYSTLGDGLIGSVLVLAAAFAAADGKYALRSRIWAKVYDAQLPKRVLDLFSRSTESCDAA
ncbi:hypothetical protein CcCBS67573_g08582 [Chytriomyces confervae]|uniref:CN hydrolase domain-containing protein n=1 Tax=Chytriomyces confervae TaxID=246404 RepID=A0A507EKP3_9FUNG|nr:hypothetical protein CcCBS67573_g08582 [Chytriomyces confervae]